MNQLRIADAGQLAEGETLKFEFKRAGRLVEGFLACFAGQHVAYENICRHIAISLDYGDGRFFAKDGQHFICQSHGAVYEPLTGVCVRGPCAGDQLKSLRISVENDGVWLLIQPA
ncbi:MAG: Rieske 2Fe-2S domain-containing protein [Verrucomicrobia bacterium]|jgi:nitrite reductase/ring-hydroxylating ferredoxin subunit|nr:Rieske 2Fe-2S domain-containing protein [Verrucomicrobiota bacterium]